MVLLIVIFLILLIKFKASKLPYKFKKVNNIILEIKKRQILSKYMSGLNTENLLIISLILFYLIYLFFNKVYDSILLATIQSLPILLLPYVILSVLIHNEKYKIIKTLPNFCINVKNQLAKNTNIVLAIKNTRVLSPLKKYIDQFLVNINNSMEVNVAFSNLKKQVEVNEFSQLISLFQICYQNGGDFINILEKYTKFELNKIAYKEKEKQNAQSSILILVIMVIMSFFILIFFVMQEIEYKQIILNSFLGNIILVINVLSYIFCFWVVFKIYRME